MSDSRRTGSDSSLNSNLHTLENLEPRFLLSTVYGGESFRYFDVNGQLVEITVDGNAIVELIGAEVSGSTAILGDLPGEITDSDLGREGFNFLAGGGLTVIGDTYVVDNDAPFQTPEGINAPPTFDGSLVTLESLASRADGRTFSINIPTVEVG